MMDEAVRRTRIDFAHEDPERADQVNGYLELRNGEHLMVQLTASVHISNQGGGEFGDGLPELAKGLIQRGMQVVAAQGQGLGAQPSAWVPADPAMSGMREAQPAPSRSDEASATSISDAAISDAQGALIELFQGWLDTPPPEVLIYMEGHLRRRLPILKNLVRLLGLPAENLSEQPPMWVPTEAGEKELWAAVCSELHAAGKAGLTIRELKGKLKAVGVHWEPGDMLATVQAIGRDGRAMYDAEARRWHWVVKTGEEQNDLGVLNAVYDGMGGTPQAPESE